MKVSNVPSGVPDLGDLYLIPRSSLSNIFVEIVLLHVDLVFAKCEVSGGNIIHFFFDFCFALSACAIAFTFFSCLIHFLFF